MNNENHERELGDGKTVLVRTDPRWRVLIRGAGQHAGLSREQARALLSALRDYEANGLLDEPEPAPFDPGAANTIDVRASDPSPGDGD